MLRLQHVVVVRARRQAPHDGGLCTAGFMAGRDQIVEAALPARDVFVHVDRRLARGVEACTQRRDRRRARSTL